MKIYFFLEIFYLLASVFERKGIKNTYNRYIVGNFLVLPMFLVVAFRSYQIGIDTPIYYAIYNSMGRYQSIVDAMDNSVMEHGYIAINYIFYQLGFSYYALQFLFAAFIYFSLGRALVNYSTNMGFSCFLFMSMQRMFGTMNQVRMWIAAAILLFTIDSIRDRKLIRFLAIVLIAGLFHKSAFVFVIVYFIVNIKERLRKWIIMGAVSLIIAFVGAPFFELLTSQLGVYENYVNRFVSSIIISVAVSLLTNLAFLLLAIKEKLWDAEIINREINKSQKSISVITPFGILPLKKNTNKERIKTGRVIFNLLLLTVCFDIVGIKSTIMGRITAFFSMFVVVAVPLLISKVANKHNNLIIYSCVLGYFLLYFVLFLIARTDSYGVIPYESMFGAFHLY